MENISPNPERYTPERPAPERRFVRRTVVISAALMCLMALSALAYAHFEPELTFWRARKAVETSKYAHALHILANMEETAQTQALTDACSYGLAMAAFDAGDYSDAAERFRALRGYSDAQTMEKTCMYRLAQAAFDAGDYAHAAAQFLALTDYSDSAERYAESRYALAERAAEAGDAFAIELFLEMGDYRDARTRAGLLAAGLTGIANPEVAITAYRALSPEQVGAAAAMNEARSFLRRGAIAVGFYHTAAVTDAGRVLACGRNTEKQCDVAGWTNVVMVAAGAYHTVGLKRDGTLVACGRDGEGQCDVSGWTDVVMVAAGDYNTYGLRRDGTVLGCGYSDVSDVIASWQNISAIAAGAYALIGISDGVALGTHPSASAAELTRLIAAGVSTGYAVGLRSDGTVVSTLAFLPDITGVADLSCSPTAIMALLSDGTVETVFFRKSAAYEVSANGRIVGIACGGTHSAVVTEDGRVLAFGANSYGECETGGWSLSGE